MTEVFLMNNNNFKTEVKVFENPNFGSMRAVEINGEPWLVGKDVAEILGYSDTAKAIRVHVDEDDKQLFKVDEMATLKTSNYGVYIINESGLYSLIFSSKLPKAKEFKRWVTSEVLPAIRKYGGYVQPGGEEEFLTNPNSPIYNYIKQMIESIEYLQAEVLALKPTLNKKKIDVWKKYTYTPIVNSIAEKFQIDFREALDLVYDRMRIDFGFNKSFALNEFSDKYIGESGSCIDAIADNPVYQSNFVHAANSILNLEILKLPNDHETSETKHSIAFTIDDDIDHIIKTIAETKGYKTKNPIWIYNRIYKMMTTPKAWRNSMTRNCCSSKKALVQKSHKYKKMFIKACNEFLYS